MPCSGSTVGYRVAMLKYLEIGVRRDEGMDQCTKVSTRMATIKASIIGYFTRNNCRFATAVLNRASIVNTVGA
jgi:hypothetical protein